LIAQLFHLFSSPILAFFFPSPLNPHQSPLRSPFQKDTPFYGGRAPDLSVPGLSGFSPLCTGLSSGFPKGPFPCFFLTFPMFIFFIVGFNPTRYHSTLLPFSSVARGSEPLIGSCPITCPPFPRPPTSVCFFAVSQNGFSHRTRAGSFHPFPTFPGQAVPPSPSGPTAFFSPPHVQTMAASPTKAPLVKSLLPFRPLLQPPLFFQSPSFMSGRPSPLFSSLPSTPSPSFPFFTGGFSDSFPVFGPSHSSPISPFQSLPPRKTLLELHSFLVKSVFLGTPFPR